MPLVNSSTPSSADSAAAAATRLWHTLDCGDVLQWLQADPHGLTNQEAKKRLQTYGPNRLTEGRHITAFQVFAGQFKNILVVILLLAVGLSAALGHDVEAAVIGIIVLFAIGLGFIQEYRAERAIDALRTMTAPTATVLRGGEEQGIPASDIVPGDIVLLAAGSRVPADGRLLDSINLQMEEAVLTGESLPVEKHIQVIAQQEAPLGERKNMVFAGTAAAYGRGKYVATATGMRTEFGAIAGMLQQVESRDTPLQKNLDRVGRTLAKVAAVLVFLVAVAGLLRGEPLLDMLIFGIALAVAVVPEALPAVVTISLAIGVQRMAKRHALVRKLPAVETLGCTSVICSDKTGTLTKDEMTVRRILAGGEVFEVTGSGYNPEGAFLKDDRTVAPTPALLELLKGAVLCSDSHVVHAENVWDVTGDPTEGALVVAALKARLEKQALETQSPRVAEIPFSSETKRMTTLHEHGDSFTAYAKGAPEVLLASCTKQLLPEGEKELTEHDRADILARANAMADSALRVIAVARKHAATMDTPEQGMTFLGLTGMLDPPRPEAKRAVAQCKQAGIRVLMITGDHPATAVAIARELGILGNGDAITGVELDALDDAAFMKRVDAIAVYARVSPAHKLRVVHALQERGEVVAMTGDGVNDAPALKKADVGIAMGITGTDVTKEAAVMMLTDDNFASIVAAVEEGRRIFGNVKKYLMYLLSSNIGEIGLMTVATLIGIPLPLSAVQILYVNLATDGLPALALAVDPPEAGLMRRPPRNAHTGIFTRNVVGLLLLGGAWSACSNLGLFLWALRVGRPLGEAMTMAFASLVLIEFFKSYSFRSDRESALSAPFANTWLNLAVLWEIVLLMLVIYVPVFQAAFGTVALSAQDWAIVAATACTVLPVLEFGKALRRRFGGND